MVLIACSRMYNVTPEVSGLWSALYDRIAERAETELEVIPHAAPAPMADLWARQDLGAVFMCGWPFSLRRPQPRIIAAPVPAASGVAAYHSVFVVRHDSSGEGLTDYFGQRFAWMSADSHSGWNAPRQHLLPFVSADRQQLFSDMVGPLVSPRAVLEAVANGSADITAVDSWWYDLLARYQPELVSRLRIIDQTASGPLPLLIASPDCDDGAALRLQNAFTSLGREPDETALLDQLLLIGFTVPQAPDYLPLHNRAQQAVSAGYPVIR
ncbi:MAG: PhnD/SsuA/transferrin family substrate-binding protein [Rhodospirillales bacterium]